jgi:hypothetical protein
MPFGCLNTYHYHVACHRTTLKVVEFLNADGTDGSTGNTYPYWGEIGDWRDTIGAFTGAMNVVLLTSAVFTRGVIEEYSFCCRSTHAPQIYLSDNNKKCNTSPMVY